jgi:hypothetical protein
MMTNTKQSLYNDFLRYVYEKEDYDNLELFHLDINTNINKHNIYFFGCLQNKYSKIVLAKIDDYYFCFDESEKQIFINYDKNAVMNFSYNYGLFDKYMNLRNDIWKHINKI